MSSVQTELITLLLEFKFPKELKNETGKNQKMPKQVKNLLIRKNNNNYVLILFNIN